MTSAPYASSETPPRDRDSSSRPRRASSAYSATGWKTTAEYRNTELGKHEKNSKGIYYSNGNYKPRFVYDRSLFDNTAYDA